MSFLLLGVVLYSLTFFDLVYTTFSMRGGGFLTSRLSRFIWSVLLWCSKKTGNQKLLQGAGMIIISAVFFQWLTLVWGANVLITLSESSSIINAQTKVPANVWEKIYVTGYSLSTMGNGDFIGGSPGWKIYLSLISFSGIVMVTISLTYFMQVLSNVNLKRVFAGTVNGMGSSIEAILKNAWNGIDFSNVNPHLRQLSQQITTLGEMHKSFPILHYYYSYERSKSLPISVVLLDESLTVLLTRVHPEHISDSFTIHTTRCAVTDFLETLHSNFTNKSKTAPPFPALKNSGTTNLPLQEINLNDAEMVSLQSRRKILSGLLQNEGREWSDVIK